MFISTVEVTRFAFGFVLVLEIWQEAPGRKLRVLIWAYQLKERKQNLTQWQFPIQCSTALNESSKLYLYCIVFEIQLSSSFQMGHED